MSGPEPPRYLAVGRLRKPHGLKGECAVFPLSDTPDRVFTPGRSLWRLALDGGVLGDPVVIERSRPFHREWLLKFRGLDDRQSLEEWRGQFLGAPADQLDPPAPDEIYVHELDGFAVRDGQGEALGLVTALYQLPSGLTLEVQGPHREFLMPFRKDFVRQVDRSARVLVVELPEGLVE